MYMLCYLGNLIIKGRKLHEYEISSTTLVYCENILTVIEERSVFILQFLGSTCLMILHTRVILFLYITYYKILKSAQSLNTQTYYSKGYPLLSEDSVKIGSISI